MGSEGERGSKVDDEVAVYRVGVSYQQGIQERDLKCKGDLKF